MSIASLDNTKLSRRVKPSFWDAMAKKALQKAFSQIKVGRLVLEDNGEVQAFGEPAETADVVAHVSVHHPATYRRIFFGGSIGAGEAYMMGCWDASNLLNVIRIMVLNLEMLNDMDSSRPIVNRLSSKFLHLFNANTLDGSRKNISAHYDLSNEFFASFLDPTMMYSSAIFSSDEASLEEASTYKLEQICRKLRLSEDDHLMEIGTGWGGMAIYAAKHYNCRVTTTTISREQYDHARNAVEAAGLQHKVTVLLEDYRNLAGKFDKLVSIEMIEAVGHEHYGSYFRKCSELLKPDGLMLIQAITICDQRYEEAKRSVDFIQQYIFPGGCLPSNEVIARNISANTDMQIVGHEDIGADYARTLAQWRKNFYANSDAVNKLGLDDVFFRMWDYYLCYCEGGFMERVISTAQIVFAKPQARCIKPL